MAHPKIEYDELLEKLLNVFRKFGYDGASLEQIAGATGLKKASLYYRFPKGKTQMVVAVIDSMDTWVINNPIKVLQSAGDPEVRLRKALQYINELYGKGEKACLLRALSQGQSLSFFQDRITKSFDIWMGGFTQLAVDFGWPLEKAVRLAENVMIRIQGALVLTNAMQDIKLFQRTLDDIFDAFGNPPAK